MTLSGVVVRGDGIGAKLGFPTANLSYEGPPPERGVWEVEVEGLGRAVCNVGVRPTVTGAGKVVVEVHIPGWSGDLYGKTLKVAFSRKLRDEKKFASVDELKAQIARDVGALNLVDYAPMDKLNEDNNLLGRVGAIVVMIAVVWGVARVTGVCPIGCSFFKP
jgi:FAD synthase